MTAQGVYKVFAGSANRPSIIKGGVVEKGSGQTVVTEREVYSNVACNVGVPNKCDSWGIRLNKKGEIPKDAHDNIVKLSPTSTDYDGQIMFLKRGDKRGTPISTRYLRGYNSLDVQYQDLVLGAKDNIKDDDIDSVDYWFINLKSGLNIFDRSVDPLYIEFIKNHDYNWNSDSRHPQVVAPMFKNIEEEEEKDITTKTLSSKFDCFTIIKDAAKDNTFGELRRLFDIVKNNFRVADVDNGDLYDTLMELADKDAENIVLAIEAHKRELNTLLEKAKAYDLLDLTKNGEIQVLIDNKKHIATKDVPAKGEQMLVWLIGNYLNEKSADAFIQIKKAADKAKS